MSILTLRKAPYHMIGEELLFEEKNPIDQKIIEAFMALYATKPIDKISIKSITDGAGLNRGTFYLHYLDIYDLLDHIEESCHKFIKIIARESLKALFKHHPLEDGLPSIDFYKKRLDYLQLLLCHKGKSSLEQVMKDEIKKVISYHYRVKATKSPDKYDYAIEFIASAQVSTIILWIKNDMSIPLGEMSQLVQEWSTNGVLTYLES